MKIKFFWTFPALALAGFAQAQSSVILYGVADSGLLGAKSPNGFVTRVITGGQYGSRWGIRGVETLSNGLTAKFFLESGFNLDTGALGQGTACNGIANGCLFGRRATVGLSGDFGEIDLGRRESLITEVLNRLEPSGQGNTFGFNGSMLRNQPRGYPERYSNEIRYETPAVNGFSGATMYSLGETNTAAGTAKTRNDVFSLSGVYRGGPLYAGLVYNRTRDDGNLGTGATASAVTAVTPHKYRVGGASYDLDVVKLFAFGYSDKRPAAALSTQIDQRIASGGVQVPFLGNQAVAAQYGKVKDKVDRPTGHADARYLGLTYLYTVSKRTNFYANYSSIKNDHYVAAGSATNAFSVFFAGLIQDNGKSQGWELGVRHFF